MVNFILIMTGETGDQAFENVKLLVDYLAKLWCHSYNVSQKNELQLDFMAENLC